MEDDITLRLSNSGPGRELIPCRAELKNQGLDWSKNWSHSVTPGLPSTFLAFLWRMMHDLLPTQARLFRLRMPNAENDVCTLCEMNVTGDLTHSLMLCSYNEEAGKFLLHPQQVVQLDLDVEENMKLPLVYIIASVLSQVWDFRKQKKPCKLQSIRAVLEAGVNILRKSRHFKIAENNFFKLA